MSDKFEVTDEGVPSEDQVRHSSLMKDQALRHVPRIHVNIM